MFAYNIRNSNINWIQSAVHMTVLMTKAVIIVAKKNWKDMMIFGKNNANFEVNLLP